MNVYRLPKELKISSETCSKIERDYLRFAAEALPSSWEEFVRQEYGLDVSSTYAGMPIRNPFGKASGQLSLNVAQVRRDAEDGLGFVILKTIIAEDECGVQSMS